MKKTLLSGALLLSAAVLTVGPASADFAVATAGPMTGQYASFGAQMKAGAEQAVADINAAGGINGEKITLEVGDDACDPKQAVAVANQLAGKGVKFVAGHYCSGSSIPASAVYAEEGVVQISPASTNPKFTEERPADFIARVCGRDDKQGTFAGQWIADKYKGKKVAILDDKSAYGKGLADETKKALNAAGLTEAMNESYTAGEKDYTALVSKMKQAGIDVVYIGGYHTEAGLILRQMREQGLQAQMLSGDALATEEFWAITGPAGEGMMFTFAPDPRKIPDAAAIVKVFEGKGINPEGYTLYTYAAMQVYKQAAEMAKSTDPEKIAAAMKNGTFKTVLGPIKFDAKGDVTVANYVWYIWKDGKYAEL